MLNFQFSILVCLCRVPKCKEHSITKVNGNPPQSEVNFLKNYFFSQQPNRGNWTKKQTKKQKKDSAFFIVSFSIGHVYRSIIVVSVWVFGTTPISIGHHLVSLSLRFGVAPISIGHYRVSLSRGHTYIDRPSPCHVNSVSGTVITTKKCYFVDLIIMVLSTFE